MINQYAQQDGINPYTYQPIHNNHVPAEQAAAGVTAAGLGGAALGVAGSEAYHSHQKDKLEEQAALESAQVAAPDTNAQYVQNSEAQAAREAALVAAPDTLKDIPSDDKIMSGGRSMGEIPASGAGIMSDAYPDQATTAQTENVPNPLETVLRPLTEDTRPTLAAGQNHMSVTSISQLHVPGEFPKPA